MTTDAPAQASTAEDQALAPETAQTLLPSASDLGVTLAPDPVSTSASEPVTFDYSSIDGIRKAAESNDALRNFLTKERLDAEKRGADAEKRRLRLEGGSRESAQKTVQQIVARLNNGEDPEAVARDLPPYVAANADSERALVLKALTQQAIELATPDEQSALQALLDEADDPEAVTKITGHTLDALAKRIERQTREALTPEVLDEDPKFREYIAARVAKELETELTAQRTEQGARSVAPSTPVGAAVPGTADLVDQIVNMPPDEQKSYMLDLAMNNPEEFERVEKMLYEAGGIRQ